MPEQRILTRIQVVDKAGSQPATVRFRKVCFVHAFLHAIARPLKCLRRASKSPRVGDIVRDEPEAS